MQRLEVSGAVRPLYGSLGVKRLAQRRHNVVDNPLHLTSERSSFCKDGIPNLCVRFRAFAHSRFDSISPGRTGWTPHDVISHSFHVLRGSCSCERTRWFLLHYRAPCSKRCDPPEEGITTWNVPMTPDIETATKESLSFNNRFTTFYETVVCEHKML